MTSHPKWVNCQRDQNMTANSQPSSSVFVDQDQFSDWLVCSVSWLRSYEYWMEQRDTQLMSLFWLLHLSVCSSVYLLAVPSASSSQFLPFGGWSSQGKWYSRMHLKSDQLGASFSQRSTPSQIPVTAFLGHVYIGRTQRTINPRRGHSFPLVLFGFTTMAMAPDLEIPPASLDTPLFSIHLIHFF